MPRKRDKWHAARLAPASPPRAPSPRPARLLRRPQRLAARPAALLAAGAACLRACLCARCAALARAAAPAPSPLARPAARAPLCACAPPRHWRVRRCSALLPACAFGARAPALQPQPAGWVRHALEWARWAGSARGWPAEALQHWRGGVCGASVRRFCRGWARCGRAARVRCWTSCVGRPVLLLVRWYARRSAPAAAAAGRVARCWRRLKPPSP